MNIKEVAQFLDKRLPHTEARSFRDGRVVMISADDIMKLVDEVLSHKRCPKVKLFVNDNNMSEVLDYLRKLDALNRRS